MTWQEAARGIPVWEGAKVIERDDTTTGTVVHVRRNGRLDVWCVDHCESADSAWFPEDCIPDLSDPDTQAAYLRRLAVALGCPEEHASALVGFVDDGGWFLVAGCPLPPPPEVPGVGGLGKGARFPFVRSLPKLPDDRLEALALAWPADKRVSS